jgi:aryl-alcohol dehydrogenase-like predicted oxidoreductase
LQFRKLGSSLLNVSVVGFGCWQIGGYYWGAVDESEWIAAVHRAVDLGVNFFDTADFYGFGRSEELLSRALGNRREDVLIATKVGLVSRGGITDFGATELLELEDHIERDLRSQHIVEAAEASLRRLRTDVIDLYLLHWPDPRTPLEETMSAMATLVETGKVRAVGCCNFSPEQMREAASYLPLAAHEMPYSLLDRSVERELLPACRTGGVGVVAYWVLCKGLLAGKYSEDAAFGLDDWRHHDPLFKGEAFRRNLRIVEELRSIAAGEGMTPAQLAITWALQQPGVTSAIIGAKRPEQAEQNAAAGDLKLSPDAQAKIQEILADKGNGQ